MNEIDLYNGDCLETVQMLIPDNSIDSIITDPPYGLEFMGKGWDKGVPSVEFWAAFLQAAKPGATLMAFGGTRTYHRMAVAIEDAGWEIRDCMMWLYGSGFPKSHNFKEGPFKGWGTALKPAWEPIIVAMKPLDGTFAHNAEKHGVAGINIDGSRIGTEARVNPPAGNVKGGNSYNMSLVGMPQAAPSKDCVGRWPANLLLDEEAGKLLDEQTGELKSGDLKPYKQAESNANVGYAVVSGIREVNRKGDSGGASRFFYCAKASKSERNEGLEGMPLVECRTGCGGEMPTDDDGKARDRFKKQAQNFHPTVKPIKLMEYLCTLTKTPTGGTVLDPFMGSGTTGIAAKNTGRSFIGIEKDPEYFKIAEARINNAEVKNAA